MSIFDERDIYDDSIINALKNDAIANWKTCGLISNWDSKWDLCDLSVNKNGRIDGHAFEWFREDECSRKVCDPIPSVYKFGVIQRYFNCYMNAEDMHILPQRCDHMSLLLEGDKVGKGKIHANQVKIYGNITDISNLKFVMSPKPYLPGTTHQGGVADHENELLLATEMDLEAHMRINLKLTTEYHGSHITIKCAKPSHRDLFGIYKDIRRGHSVDYFKNIIPRTWPDLTHIWLSFEEDNRIGSIRIMKVGTKIELDAWGGVPWWTA